MSRHIINTPNQCVKQTDLALFASVLELILGMYCEIPMALLENLNPTRSSPLKQLSVGAFIVIFLT
jgi:hypothetical protein